jgi:pimeloyl-ACP methyl ester carboxylesterase
MSVAIDNDVIVFQDRFWTSKDGLTLHARDYGAAQGKLPVVCIPGLTRNCRDFEDLAPWMSTRGRRVLAVDLRGRGQSERDPDRRHYQPIVYADDIVSLLHSIGALQALFVGTSLGGLVTMSLAARRPDLIGGAVLNDVGPRVAGAGLRRIASYVGKTTPVQTWADALAYVKQINAVAFPHYEDERWAVVARRLFKEDESGAPVLDYDPLIFKKTHPFAIWLTAPLVWGAYKRLSRCGPLLILRGAFSDILDLRTVQQMRRVTPRAVVANIPGVGHAPMLDEPAALSALADFLDCAP